MAKDNKPRYSLIPVQVCGARLVTPNMKRITVGGSALSDFKVALPAQWLKIFVPPKEGDGLVGRAYTVRSFDPVRTQLDLDLVLHGDNGPGLAWAARVAVGETAHISSQVHPRSGYHIDPSASWQLLLGDETSIPSVSSIVEALPQDVSVKILIEVTNEADEQTLPAHPRTAVTWLHRRQHPGGTTGILEQAVREIDLPNGRGQVWVAAEASSVRAIRQHLSNERGLSHDQLHATAYWKRGEAGHRDLETLPTKINSDLSNSATQ